MLSLNKRSLLLRLYFSDFTVLRSPVQYFMKAVRAYTPLLVFLTMEESKRSIAVFKYGISCRLLDWEKPPLFLLCWWLNFIRYFSCICWDDHKNVLYSINVSKYIFLSVEPTLYSWANFPWSWCIILSLYYWTWFIKTLSRVYASVFVRDILAMSLFLLSRLYRLHEITLELLPLPLFSERVCLRLVLFTP